MLVISGRGVPALSARIDDPARICADPDQCPRARTGIRRPQCAAAGLVSSLTLPCSSRHLARCCHQVPDERSGRGRQVRRSP